MSKNSCSINCKACRSRIVIKPVPKRNSSSNSEHIKELEQRVTELETVIQSLKDNLITINKFSGESSFKALDLNFG